MRAPGIVRPPVEPLTEEEVRAKLASGLLRLTTAHGPQKVGLKIGCHEKTVRAARDQSSTLRIDLALNLLALDPTALDEVLAGYGMRLVPLQPDALGDLHTAAGLIEGAGELVRANADGRRDHRETMAIADKLRPYLPALIAIVDQADALRETVQ